MHQPCRARRSIADGGIEVDRERLGRKNRGIRLREDPKALVRRLHTADITLCKSLRKKRADARIVGRRHLRRKRNTHFKKVFFNLTEEPQTTFENGNLVIRTSRTTVSYPLTNVLRYTYEGGTITDVGEAKVHPGEMRFLQNDDTMAFDGLPEGMRLDVYTLDGLKVKTVQAQNGQRTTISLADQPAGTYIVKAGDATFKFLKR